MKEKNINNSDHLDFLTDRYLCGDLTEDEAAELLRQMDEAPCLLDRINEELRSDAMLRDIAEMAEKNNKVFLGRTFSKRDLSKDKCRRFFWVLFNGSAILAAVFMLVAGIVFISSRLTERHLSEKYLVSQVSSATDKSTNGTGFVDNINADQNINSDWNTDAVNRTGNNAVNNNIGDFGINSADFAKVGDKTTGNAVRRKETRSNALATIVKTDKVVWKKGCSRYMAGDIIAAGWLRFDSGSVLVEFFSGAAVRIEGPADFMVVSPELAYCLRGEVFVNVPPQAIGFTVDVPQMKIIDKGTEFTLNVQSQKTELHVLKGKVLIDHSSVGVQSLFAGEGILAGDNGKIQSISSTESLSSSDLFSNKLSAAECLALKKKWEDKKRRWSEDPSALVFFDMVPVGAKRQLVNFSRHHNKNGINIKNNTSFNDAKNAEKERSNEWGSDDSDFFRDGSIVGCQTGKGSFPGKESLEFRRISDRVRFFIPGEQRACTFFVRLRIDGLDRLNNSLLMSDARKTQGIGWYVIRDDNNRAFVRFEVSDLKTDRVFHYDSGPCLNLNDIGRWISLAVVIDQESGRLFHYLNGKKISESVLEHKYPVRIGFAELGNGRLSRFASDFAVRNFSGAIDQFAYFNRSLDAKEIGDL